MNTWSILLLQRSYYLLNNRYNAINLALTYVYRACSELSPSNQEKIADLVFAQRTWKRVLFLCDRDLPLILEKESNDQTRIENRTKEGQELQEYYNAQKFWISVNQAEASFGLGDFESHQKYLQTAQNIPHHTWMWESFSDQLAKLRGKLAAVGDLVEPSWTAPV
jgi:hypothetical protein